MHYNAESVEQCLTDEARSLHAAAPINSRQSFALSRLTTSGMVSSFDNGIASLYGCGQFRRRISADFVPISLRAGVPPSAATNDMQSVRSSVGLSVCSPGSTNRSASPSRGAVHLTRPFRSVGADRPWSRGCNGSDQSIVRPPSRSARSFVRISLLRCFRH